MDSVSSIYLDNLSKYERKLAEELGNLFNLSDDVYDESAHVYGRGGYGDVFKAKSQRHGGIAVAVKRLRVHVYRESNKVAKVLLQELRVWSSVQHPNVLGLLGYVMRGQYPALVSVWMAKGSLRSFMDENPNKAMDVAEGISSGLLYLHDKDIIHSDLKCDNILLSEADEPLLSDFGISRFVTSVSISNTSTNVNGSTRWMAKEFFRFDPNSEESEAVVEHSKETDVWAFGMVIYELLSGQVPFSEHRNDAQVIFELAQGHTPSQPNSPCPREAQETLWQISQSCWRLIPSERPKMDTIYNELHDSTNIYICAPVDFSSQTSNTSLVADRELFVTDINHIEELLDPRLRNCYGGFSRIKHDLRLPVTYRSNKGMFHAWTNTVTGSGDEVFVTKLFNFPSASQDTKLNIKLFDGYRTVYRTVTGRDVLSALHAAFHTPPKLEAWEQIETFDPVRRDLITRAYETRILERAVRLGTTVAEEKQKGLMWLDWLGPRTFFGGLTLLGHMKMENGNRWRRFSYGLHLVTESDDE